MMPAEFTVCGIRLIPLTVGHARILDALSLWGARDPRELIVAAYLCSGKASKFERRFNAWWFRHAVRFWAWRLGKKWDYAASAQCWDAFVAYNRDEPATVNKRKSEPTRTPLLACMRVTLCGSMGYDPEKFDDQRLAQVLLDYSGVLEADGAVRSLAVSTGEIREFARLRN